MIKKKLTDAKQIGGLMNSAPERSDYVEYLAKINIANLVSKRFKSDTGVEQTLQKSN